MLIKRGDIVSVLLHCICVSGNRFLDGLGCLSAFLGHSHVVYGVVSDSNFYRGRFNVLLSRLKPLICKPVKTG